MTSFKQEQDRYGTAVRETSGAGRRARRAPAVFRRALAALALAALCAAGAAGCASGAGDGSGSAGASGTGGAPSQDALTVAENGSSAYSIVRGDDCPLGVTSAALALQKGIKEATGAELPLRDELRWTKAGSPKPVIYIGECGDARTKSAASGLRDGDYRVTAEGSDIFISAGSAETYAEAVDAFLAQASDGTLAPSFPDGVCLSKTVAHKLSLKLPGDKTVDSIAIVYEGTEPRAQTGAADLADTLSRLTGIIPAVSISSPKHTPEADLLIRIGGIFVPAEEPPGGKPPAAAFWSVRYSNTAGRDMLTVAASGGYTVNAAIPALTRLLGTAPAGDFDISSVSLRGSVISSAKADPAADGAVRVMTSNILWTDTKVMVYSDRARLWNDIFDLFMPDVISFNEFYGTLGENLAGLLARSYDLIYPEYEDIWNGDYTGYVNSLEKLQQHVCATPIAIRKASGLELVASGFRYTSEKWWIHSISWCVVKTPAGDLLGVCGNHYGAMSEGNFGEDTVACIASVRQKYGDIPFVVTGDLYAHRGDLPYNTIIKAGFTDGFSDSTACVVNNGSYHDPGSITTSSSTPIDHVLCDTRLRTLRYHIIIDNISKFCSDHYPIYADVAFRH